MLSGFAARAWACRRLNPRDPAPPHRGQPRHPEQGAQHEGGTRDPGQPAQGPPEIVVLRLESVMDGVLVTGTASVSLSGECVRCLTYLTDTFTADVQELYLYDDADPDEDEETSRMDGDLLDLEPAVRDAIVLSLPQNPLCTPDCPGLCPVCGFRLADDPSHAHEEVLDPRWAALRDLDVGAQSRSAEGESPEEKESP